MNNYVSSGERVDLVVPSGGVVGGTFYKVSDMIGCAVRTAAEGETGTLIVEGILTAPKAAVAFTVGARVFWDDSAKNFTTVTGGNTLAGISVETIASGVATAPIRLNGSF